MVVLLLALSMMASADPVADLVERAQTRLSVSDCADNDRCTATDTFRVPGDDDGLVAITAKDRAFSDDGSYCGVVGDKQCLSRPRLRFHASLPGQGALGPIQMSPILPRR
jgi:hypothetical protein